MLNKEIEDIEIPKGYEGLGAESLAMMFASKLAIIARFNAISFEQQGEKGKAIHKNKIADEYDQLAKLISMGIIK